MTIATRLNDKQRERIARNIVGYQGPMSGFNQFLESDQAKKTVYNNAIAQIDQKMAVKMQSGGNIIKAFRGTFSRKSREENNQTSTNQAQTSGDVAAAIDKIYKDPTEGFGRSATQEEIDYYTKEFGEEVDPTEAASLSKRLQESKGATPKPTKPKAETVQAEKITYDPRQDVKFEKIEDVKTVDPTKATAAEQVTVPDARDAVKAETTKVAEDTKDVLKDVKAVQGEVSNKAQMQAQTVDATASAVKSVNAAEIDKAVQIDNIPKRKVQAEELVSGSAVKSAEVEQNLEKFQAAQMELDPMATTQGQLNKLLQDFDAGNPPPWAAAGMRAANAVLNQRGLGASSIAGQAIIQAQMEAALPIAQSDAQTVFNLGIQNLSNRQQRAVIAAQQRAQFLGQEFDQEFQARVTNAARISDIANQNFNAEVQVTLENARMAQSVDLANLNNRQALVMADAAQIANLEMTNLNNRQQAAVQNAQAFLQMDMTNLQYKQQTQLFKAQEQIKAMFTDAAAENAAAQFNASSQNQVNQFYDSLANQTKQFNVTQKNAMEQFNTQQENAIKQFNAQQENAVAQFNASNGLVVSQANAEWRRNIATLDTAAINQANQINAQNAMALTVREYEGLWQEFRDKMQFAHNTSENALDREMQYGIAVMNKDAQIEAAKFAMKGQLYSALGGLAAAGMSNLDIGSLIKKALNMVGGGKEEEGTGTGTGSGTGVYDDPFGLDMSTLENPDGTTRDVVVNTEGDVVFDPKDQGGTGVGEDFIPTQAEGGTTVDPNTGEIIDTGVTSGP